ncbi:MAG: hypothetical protein WCF26_06980 [Candidatus Sulfotelmatobacter sp.]
MIPVSRVVPHLCGLPKAQRYKRVLLMFRGFFDECNRNPEDVRFIMAGWTATVEEWERFTEAWQGCLSSKPSIKYFKTSESNSLSDQFYKFSTTDRDAKVLALSKIIASHDIRGYIALAEHNLLANRPAQLRQLIGTYMGTRMCPASVGNGEGVRPLR